MGGLFDRLEGGLGGRVGLEVLEGFEGAEVHAVGGVDAALKAGKWIESGMESVAEGGIVSDGGVEEIGVAPQVLVELFTYLTSPGLTDEEITLFLGVVDASRAAIEAGIEREATALLRVPIDAGAERKDGSETGQASKQPARRMPGAGIGDVGGIAEALRP